MSTKSADNKSFVGRLTHRIRREQISFNNFVLTDGIFIALIVIPLLGAFIIYRIHDAAIYMDQGSVAVHDNLLLSILTFGKLTMVVLIGYILTFRFSKGQDNGIYGYWLALGLDRERFFIYTTISLTLFSTIGIYAGVLSNVLFFSLYLPVVDMLILFLLILISQLFLIVLILSLDEIIEWSEITLVSVLLPYFLINSFIDTTTLPGAILFAENTIVSGEWLMPMIFQLVAAIILFYFAFSMHQSKDIELGG